jgi:outer membrane biogenesis lipoprotein LolB
MFSFLHGFVAIANFVAALVTIGIALLLACCVECTHCPKREKDDLFRRKDQ